ncbi:hypothetical protein, partial [Alistipes ihumii]|uniref:hypothetical protein n=1 Tax=Alistipes ihumii TaxID=1470347 RepID=UPI003AF00658
MTDVKIGIDIDIGLREPFAFSDFREFMSDRFEQRNISPVTTHKTNNHINSIIFADHLLCDDKISYICSV